MSPAAKIEGARFVGKRALITGANDRGIGGAIAEALAKEGAAISIASPSEPPRLMKKLHKLGYGVCYSACDVTQPSSIAAAVARTVAELGGIEIVVNNAGIEFASPLAELSEDNWSRLLDINLHGAIRMTQACLPHLAPESVIVNIASALGVGGCAGFTIYSASKAGLIGFTQSLAIELAPRKIRAVAVAPGLIATPMTFKHIDRLDDAARATIQQSHPLGVGLPHDVAAAVCFLASQDARLVTGVTLPIAWLPQYRLPVEQYAAAANEERKAA